MIGIDEVGRGAWAGPLLVCAVRLHEPIAGLKDSKLLSKPKRHQLAALIKLTADVGYGWVSPQLIDKIGLTAATKRASQLSLVSMRLLPAEDIIIDGNIDYLPELNATAIVKADQTVKAVSAASIVAKVARDDYMNRLAKRLPQYGFERHVGYGTKLHRQAIQLYGLTKYHRRSFKPCQL